MGYTHYWKVTEQLDDGWDSFLNDARAIIAQAGRGDIEICGDDGIEGPELSWDAVLLNGTSKNNEWHEPFVLYRKPIESDFCKTARKPYDLVVTALLMLAANRWDAVSIESDGDPEDWEPGRELISRALSRDVPIPAGVGGLL